MNNRARRVWTTAKLQERTVHRTQILFKIIAKQLPITVCKIT